MNDRAWNYRVIGDEEHGYEIYEAYYNSEGAVEMTSASPVGPYGDTLVELAKDMDLMSLAFGRPVLTRKDVPWLYD